MDRRTGLGGDILVALALAAVLGIGWCLRAAGDLARLRLPDADDVMRLQQIRDWLAGQPFGDLTQHRLAHGLPMHWSRLADLVPGGAISLLTPAIGAHAAEVAVVSVWPLVLFALAILLVTRLTRALGSGHARTAAVVAAIAYPATTVFLPGRIDHHGLQLVLLLGAVLAAAARASVPMGAVTGLAVAASLTVGMETAVPLAALCAVLVIDWIGNPAGSAARLIGLGTGALGGLIAARVVFAGSAWSYPACDGFTKDAWAAAAVLAWVPLVLAVLPEGWRARCRLAAALGVAGVGAGIALRLSPDCLAPYGRVDPLLARLWLVRVEEAQPLFSSLPVAIGYGGVMIAGLCAAAWRWRVERSRGWALMVAVQAASLLVACVQARGAYGGAMLAAPALAAAIGEARARGTLPLVAAWIASAGMLYPFAASALVRAPRVERGGQRVACDDGALLDRLATLPAAIVMAPIDAGPWILAATPHRVVAAPYHRNNAGNLAAYRFFGGSAAQARSVATQWHVRYVVACGNSTAAPVARLRPLPCAGGARYEVVR